MIFSTYIGLSIMSDAKSLQAKYDMVSQQMNYLFYQGFSEEEQRQFERYLARILETIEFIKK